MSNFWMKCDKWCNKTKGRGKLEAIRKPQNRCSRKWTWLRAESTDEITDNGQAEPKQETKTMQRGEERRLDKQEQGKVKTRGRGGKSGSRRGKVGRVHTDLSQSRPTQEKSRAEVVCPSHPHNTTYKYTLSHSPLKINSPHLHLNVHLTKKNLLYESLRDDLKTWSVL